jgi:hypothetical protein
VSEPDATFDPEQLAAAERLDDQIDDVLAGRTRADAAPEVLLLAAAVRTDPPLSLAHRIEQRRERELRRRWRPFRYAAAAMAYLFVSQGIGNLAFGDWVADGVGDDFSPHLTREGGFALIAVGVAVAAGAVTRRLAPVSAAAGVPLALAFGISGIGEIGVFAAGAALHITQGLVGIALGMTYWRYRRPEQRGQRRDTSARTDEEGA